MADENGNGVDDAFEAQAQNGTLGYNVPSLPPPAATTESTSRYIGGYPGDTRIPGPVSWGPWVPGQWRSPGRHDTPTLDELRSDDAGGYVVGDEWIFANESPDTILDLQRQMFQAGLLDPEADIIPGYFDDASREAFRTLLMHANGRRTDWLSTLETLRNNPIPSGADKGPKVQPFVAQVSNPEDIKMGLRDVFKEALGTGAINAGDLQALVSEFQQGQIGSQRSQYDAYVSGKGGVVTAPPSLEAFADQKAKAADPTAYDSRKVVGAADFLARKLRGDV